MDFTSISFRNPRNVYLRRRSSAYLQEDRLNGRAVPVTRNRSKSFSLSKSFRKIRKRNRSPREFPTGNRSFVILLWIFSFHIFFFELTFPCFTEAEILLERNKNGTVSWGAPGTKVDLVESRITWIRFNFAITANRQIVVIRLLTVVDRNYTWLYIVNENLDYHLQRHDYSFPSSILFFYLIRYIRKICNNVCLLFSQANSLPDEYFPSLLGNDDAAIIWLPVDFYVSSFV